MRGARWFLLENGSQRGPVDLETMRDLVLDGTIDPDTYVWADGMPQWMPARDVPALVPPITLRPLNWGGFESEG